jgi:hypothetical protein
MKTMNNKLLTFAFIIVGIIFLLFCGGAITMTMMNNGMNNNGMMNNISWMWIPTIVTLILSIILCWVIFWAKNE